MTGREKIEERTVLNWILLPIFIPLFIFYFCLLCLVGLLGLYGVSAGIAYVTGWPVIIVFLVLLACGIIGTVGWTSYRNSFNRRCWLQLKSNPLLTIQEIELDQEYPHRESALKKLLEMTRALNCQVILSADKFLIEEWKLKGTFRQINNYDWYISNPSLEDVIKPWTDGEEHIHFIFIVQPPSTSATFMDCEQLANDKRRLPDRNCLLGQWVEKQEGPTAVFYFNLYPGLTIISKGDMGLDLEAIKGITWTGPIEAIEPQAS